MVSTDAFPTWIYCCPDFFVCGCQKFEQSWECVEALWRKQWPVPWTKGPIADFCREREKKVVSMPVNVMPCDVMSCLSCFCQKFLHVAIVDRRSGTMTREQRQPSSMVNGNQQSSMPSLRRGANWWPRNLTPTSLLDHQQILIEL